MLDVNKLCFGVVRFSLFDTLEQGEKSLDCALQTLEKLVAEGSFTELHWVADVTGWSFVM